ncbi:hypothetical protein KAW38_01940 [Candidatus Micrarchaeota archaeon]|nr:hypothetical protein [Candidatus Micrarchaeota archaeon]
MKSCLAFILNVILLFSGIGYAEGGCTIDEDCPVTINCIEGGQYIPAECINGECIGEACIPPENWNIPQDEVCNISLILVGLGIVGILEYNARRNGSSKKKK